MSDETNFEDDPAWLLLPLARREVALRRLEVMQRHDRYENPGDKEAREAAERLGVTTGQFYRIRRLWLQRQSVFDLLPYGRPGERRQPKLDPDVAAAMTDLVRDSIKKGMRTPAAILKRLRESWPLDKPMPSHMTVRKKIEDVLGELGNSSGGLAISDFVIPKLAAKTPFHYGDIVAVDHAGLQVFVATEGGPVAPVITLAVDLFTSAICGFHLSFGAPGPIQLEAALKDAKARTSDFSKSASQTVRPRLVFQISGAGSWSKLLSRLQQNRYEADIVRTQRLHFGETLALIGPSIGEVKFSSRKFLNDWVFDPARHALVSFDELKQMVEAGVAEYNDRRLADGIVLRALDLDF